MIKNNFLKFILFLVVGANLLIPATTINAATNPPCKEGQFELNVAIGNLKCIDMPSATNKTNYLGVYILSWYNFVLATIGIIATGMIMYAGFLWMLPKSGGGDVTKAKEHIWSAIAGLLIAFLSWTILNLINPNLTQIVMPSIAPIQKVIPLNTMPTNGITESATKNNLDKEVQAILKQGDTGSFFIPSGASNSDKASSLLGAGAAGTGAAIGATTIGVTSIAAGVITSGGTAAAGYLVYKGGTWAIEKNYEASVAQITDKFLGDITSQNLQYIENKTNQTVAANPTNANLINAAKNISIAQVAMNSAAALSNANGDKQQIVIHETLTENNNLAKSYLALKYVQQELSTSYTNLSQTDKQTAADVKTQLTNVNATIRALETKHATTYQGVTEFTSSEMGDVATQSPFNNSKLPELITQNYTAMSTKK